MKPLSLSDDAFPESFPRTSVRGRKKTPLTSGLHFINLCAGAAQAMALAIKKIAASADTTWAVIAFILQKGFMQARAVQLE